MASRRASRISLVRRALLGTLPQRPLEPLPQGLVVLQVEAHRERQLDDRRVAEADRRPQGVAGGDGERVEIGAPVSPRRPAPAAPLRGPGSGRSRARGAASAPRKTAVPSPRSFTSCTAAGSGRRDQQIVGRDVEVRDPPGGEGFEAVERLGDPLQGLGGRRSRRPVSSSLPSSSSITRKALPSVVKPESSTAGRLGCRDSASVAPSFSNSGAPAPARRRGHLHQLDGDRLPRLGVGGPQARSRARRPQNLFESDSDL